MTKATRTQSAPAAATITTPLDVTAMIPEGPLPDLGEVKEPTVTELIEAGFKSKYGIELKDAHSNVVRIHDRLVAYEKAMNAKNVMNAKDGANHQVQLFNTILIGLGYLEEQMLQAVDIILMHLWSGRNDAFSSRMIYRFSSSIQRDINDVHNWQKILELMIQISNPANRGTMANEGNIRKIVGTIDERYNDVAFSIVRYLAQYQN